jgi:hypothetical protein
LSIQAMSMVGSNVNTSMRADYVDSVVSFQQKRKGQ